MDYKNISKELLKTLRGTETQAQLSQRLNYSANQVYRWESGKRLIDWSDFCRLCELKNISLAPILKSYLGYTDDFKQAHLLIQHLKGWRSNHEFSQLIKIPKSTLTSWLSQKSIPKMTDIFKIFHLSNNMLLEVLSSMVDIDQAPGLQKNFAHFSERKKAFYACPEIMDVRIALNLEDYKRLPEHTPGWVAQKMDISLEKELAAVDFLKKSALIEERDQKLVLCDVGNHLSGRNQSFQDAKTVHEYCIDRSHKILKKMNSFPINENLTSVIYSLSKEAQLEIMKALSEVKSTIRNIAAQDSGPQTEAFVLSCQFLKLNREDH